MSGILLACLNVHSTVEVMTVLGSTAQDMTAQDMTARATTVLGTTVRGTTVRGTTARGTTATANTSERGMTDRDEIEESNGMYNWVQHPTRPSATERVPSPKGAAASERNSFRRRGTEDHRTHVRKRKDRATNRDPVSSLSRVSVCDLVAGKCRK